MNKILSGLFALTMLSACGNGLISPMDNGDRIPSDDAVLIGKVVLSPALDEDGDLTKKSDDDFQTVYLYFANDKTDKKTGEGYVAFDEVETNKFFALPMPVSENSNPKLSVMLFSIKRSSWFSNTEYFYDSKLQQIEFPISQKLKAGEVYSMGTINVDLSKQSFKEIGDEEYDEEEAHYVVPKDIRLDPSVEKSAAWFKKEFPDANKKVNSAKPSMRMSGENNKFEETQVTTTYR